MNVEKIENLLLCNYGDVVTTSVHIFEHITFISPKTHSFTLTYCMIDEYFMIFYVVYYYFNLTINLTLCRMIMI